MKSSALVFDLDGTLVDSLPDLHAALNEMLRGLGRRELTPEEVRHMIGDGTPYLVQRALNATGGVAELETAHQHFLEFYEATLTNLTRLYPGVATTLRSLRATGMRLGICTNKQQRSTLAVLNGFGIDDCFDAVVCGDIVPFKKPDPRHLLATIEALGVTAGETVMVGDNENDYTAAHGAGVPVILMRYGYLRGSPEAITPDAWLDYFPDISQTVKHFAQLDVITKR